MKTETVTASLVRNQRLHLVIDGSAPACAGKRLHAATLSASVEIESLPLGPERALARRNARFDAIDLLVAKITDRSELCDRCCRV
jgi:hypothetical protein